MVSFIFFLPLNPVKGHKVTGAFPADTGKRQSTPWPNHLFIIGLKYTPKTNNIDFFVCLFVCILDVLTSRVERVCIKE